ncbi:patatin-like phospholipase family protein [Sulfuritalea sp.]|uniref:patatin-like phospholipase family protein n=1 Tax=Sulfuritalea sp. TaxID=2480090 RepID=UPI0025F1899F|nr:patatin-like phospholipase family protein [Sulfuritalea sp.]
MSSPDPRVLFTLAAAALLSGCALLGEAPTPPPAPTQIRIGLALGGGAARGFAHVGVIKALEAQGILPDIVVGTSAGAVVGALYASGLNGFELQKVAMDMDKNHIFDWNVTLRGALKGDPLRNFVNDAVSQRPLEKLKRSFAVVATDFNSGESALFRTGSTGWAVQASAAVPGVFQPVAINGREYVDGGLVSPVPARAARRLGADFVIAVDISARPRDGRSGNSIDMLLQTYAIMGQTISRHELSEADVVIRPATGELSATSLDDRHRAVLEGEKAAAASMAAIKEKLARLRNPPPTAAR